MPAASLAVPDYTLSLARACVCHALVAASACKVVVAGRSPASLDTLVQLFVIEVFEEVAFLPLIV